MKKETIQVPIFSDEELGTSAVSAAPSVSRHEKFNDYEGFTEKFKPKKTTDDCYTPQAVYDVIKTWVSENILDLSGVEVVRPFWPGGDYEGYPYPENCLVLDNPPFSKLAQIRRFYQSRGIRYFLFAPTLTLANSARELPCCYIICGKQMIYENGAKVATSYITNLDCDGTAIWVAGDLSSRIDEAFDKMKKKSNKMLPVYDYPSAVVSAAMLQKVAQRGVTLRIHRDSCTSVCMLDEQRGSGKSIFGGGWLLSERAAAERAAERDKIFYKLSQREKDIISKLK